MGETVVVFRSWETMDATKRAILHVLCLKFKPIPFFSSTIGISADCIIMLDDIEDPRELKWLNEQVLTRRLPGCKMFELTKWIE